MIKYYSVDQVWVSASVHGEGQAVLNLRWTLKQMVYQYHSVSDSEVSMYHCIIINMLGDPQSVQLRNAMYNILLALVVTLKCCHCDIVFVIVIRQLVM